jgi:hypothetical protein
VSELAFSAHLGRRIRTGAAETLGTPTSELAVAALRGGRADEAADYVDYLVEETARVHDIFTTWLRALREYGEEHVPSLDAHYARLKALIGCEPPILDEPLVPPDELAACHAALQAGDADALARRLAELRERLREVHDAQADWCWGLLTAFRDELGEARMDDVLRKTEEKWVTARYTALADLTPQELFELTIEGMRGHMTGPGRAGAVGVAEDVEKFVLSFDPCGSGGRMRRGDPERGQAPREAAPFRFGVTEAAHDWSWGEEGVCLYCAHCAVVNEILPIEHLGAPMRVTSYPTSAQDQCRWTIYKSSDAVPDDAYRRVGKTRPGGAA